jgi:hypothetical protein
VRIAHVVEDNITAAAKMKAPSPELFSARSELGNCGGEENSSIDGEIFTVAGIPGGNDGAGFCTIGDRELRRRRK